MSGDRTVGVEEELLLVDRHGHPVPRAPGIVEGPRTDGLQHELFQEQAETGSLPRREIAAVVADLRERRERLAAAAGQDVRVAATATSPFAARPTPTPEPRYLQMVRSYGATAREQLTCGCHVHVGIESRAEGVRVLNEIQPWLAVLLALTANSPFWQGEDTGYASYRRMVWDRWPSSGPTAPFADEAEYDAVVSALTSSGVLLDAGMVYFDARLSESFPTVEVRVADVCPEPEDAGLVAALCRGLVDAAARSEGRWGRARVEVLRGAAWRAAFSGLSGDLVDPVTGTPVPAQRMVQRLVDRVEPSLRRYGDLDGVHASITRILRRGTGADLQRAAFARRGELSDVVDDVTARTVPRTA